MGRLYEWEPFNEGRLYICVQLHVEAYAVTVSGYGDPNESTQLSCNSTTEKNIEV